MVETLKLFIIIMTISYVIIQILENKNIIVRLIAFLSSIGFLILGNFNIFVVASALLFILSILSNNHIDSTKFLRPKKNFLLTSSKK